MSNVSQINVGNNTYDIKDTTARSGLANKQDIIQKTTLPTASVTEEGNIYQYIGATESGLTNGYFYKCVENSGVYSWVRVNVQPGGGGGDIIDDDNVSTETTYSSSKIEDICSGDGTPRWRKSKSVNGVKIVTFADGTYDELIAMVNAHKAHTINIHEYWRVGDSRRIRINEHTDFSGRTIPAQYVNATIVNPYYATDSDVLFVVKIGSGLWNQYPIDTTGNELTNGFADSQLHNYLNNNFYLALEQGLRDLTSLFVTKDVVDNTSAVKTDSVHVTLPCITEFGFTSGSLYTKETAAGIKPFEYYYDNAFRLYYAVEDHAPDYWQLLCINKNMWSRSFYNLTNGRYIYNNGNSESYSSVSEPYVIIPMVAIK